MGTLSDIFGVGSNFLGNLTGSLGTSFGNQISNALFGRQDRLSNKDFQFYQDLADSGNPRDAARQNEFKNLTLATDIGTTNQFLKQVAPAQAEAYNTQQAATYGEDTARQTQRIQSMADGLGMSPWEITGAGGTNPIPSPSGGPPQRPQGNREAATGFLQAMTPLKVAEMGNRTALKQTEMQNRTALKQTEMQVKQADQANRRSTAEGQLPVQQAATAAAAAEQAISAAGLNNANTDKTVQATVIDLLKFVYEMLPTENMQGTLDVPGFKGSITTQQKQGFRDIVKALGRSPTARTGWTAKDDAAVREALSKMPADQWSSLRRAIRRVAQGAGNAANNTMDFLGNLTK